MNGKIFLKKITLFIFLLISVVVTLVVFNTNKINTQTFKFSANINKLILGSSETECAINDKIFKNSINMSSSGDPLLYSYLKLKKSIENNSNIDTLFLEISPRILTKFIDDRWLLNEAHFTERFGNYFTLMDNEDINLFKNHFKFNFYKIGVSSIAVRSFRNFKEYFIGDLNGVYGGFQDLQRDKLEEALERLESGYEDDVDNSLSKFAINYLDKIIEICNKNNVKLIFISTPIRNEFLIKNYDDFMKFNKFYKDNYSNITYLNFTSFKLPDSAYADLFHLNSSGSTLFTQYLEQQGIKNSVLQYGFSNQLK